MFTMAEVTPPMRILGFGWLVPMVLTIRSLVRSLRARGTREGGARGPGWASRPESWRKEGKRCSLMT
jgi:hypothetical protein